MAERTNTKHWIANYPKNNTGLDGASYIAELYKETLDEGQEVSNATCASNLVALVQPLDGFAVNPDMKLKWSNFISTNTEPFMENITKQARPLSDSTGGTAAGGLVAISGSGDDSDINNNFATIAAVLNNISRSSGNDDTGGDLTQIIAQISEIRNILVSHGIMRASGEGIPDDEEGLPK